MLLRWRCVATLKHVAQTVARIELSDHVVDVVFVLFDENGQYEHLVFFIGMMMMMIIIIIITTTTTTTNIYKMHDLSTQRELEAPAVTSKQHW